MSSINDNYLLIKILSVLLVTVLTTISCHQQIKFDKEKWLQADDLMTFPNRSYMVDDLIKNRNFKGKNLNSVVNLLGQPQYALDSGMEIGYKIEEDFGSDIDPVYTKTLLVHFDKDTTVDTIRLKEWEK